MKKWQKKLNFGPNFGRFGKKLSPQNFLQVLPQLVVKQVVPRYHPLQFKGRVMNQNWKNGKKKFILGLILAGFDPNFVPKIFSWVLPLLDIRYCCQLLLYTISRKTYEANLRKWQKPSFGPNFGPFGPNSSRQFFFRKSGCFSHYISLSVINMYYIRKKLMIQSWEKAVTNGQTDRWTRVIS